MADVVKHETNKGTYFVPLTRSARNWLDSQFASKPEWDGSRFSPQDILAAELAFARAGIEVDEAR